MRSADPPHLRPPLCRVRLSDVCLFDEIQDHHVWRPEPRAARVPTDMGSLIKKRRKRMRKKKHKKMLKATRWQRRAAGK